VWVCPSLYWLYICEGAELVSSEGESSRGYKFLPKFPQENMAEGYGFLWNTSRLQTSNFKLFQTLNLKNPKSETLQ